MIWSAAALLALAFLLSKKHPVIYTAIKTNVISESKALESDCRDPASSWLAAICCVFPCLVVYALNGNAGAAAMVLLVGCAAYSDLMTRWIPDCLIYGTVWLSLIFRADSLFMEGITGALIFCAPVLLLQGLSFWRRRTGCFASGDLYLLPAIGLWIMPEYALLVLSCGLMLALFASRYDKQIPFITCIFPAFVGYMLCEFLLS